jgi:hypothetical protein
VNRRTAGNLRSTEPVPFAPLGRTLALVVAAVAAATLNACSAPGEPPSQLGHAEAGPDPVAAIEVMALPDDLAPVARRAAEAATAAEAALGSPAPGSGASDAGTEQFRAARRARLDAATEVFRQAGFVTMIRPRTEVGATVVPGGPAELCRIDDLVAAYAGNPQTTAALATINGIEPNEVEGYLRSLRAGRLIDNEPVIAHRLVNGQVAAFHTTLEAGTAVLEDADGRPRLRCRSAVPLLPTHAEVGELVVATESFADAVVSATIGAEVPATVDTLIDGRFTDDPSRALGSTDRVAVSLGEVGPSEGPCARSVTVAFVDNRLVDGPGPDLKIVELGAFEPVVVTVGSDGDHLQLAGLTANSGGAIDLAGVVTPGQTVAVVELCDGPATGTEVPGADIDAVVALNSVAPG